MSFWIDVSGLVGLLLFFAIVYAYKKNRFLFKGEALYLLHNRKVSGIPGYGPGETRSFVNGFLNFIVPKTMVLGKKEMVSVEIFMSREILEHLPESMTVDEIKLSEIMTLKLYGEDFLIVPKSSDAQIILPEETTIWNWDVTSLKYGLKKLELLLTAKIHLNDTDTFYDFPVHIKMVKVKINRVYIVKRFLIDNWQWIVSTIVGSGILLEILKACGVIKSKS